MNNHIGKYFWLLKMFNLLFISEIKGQSTFNILIDHENQPEWGYSLLIDNDTIVMTGYTNILKDGFYRDGIFFRKLDISGNVFLEKLFADTCVLLTIGSTGNLLKVDDYYLTNGTYQYCDTAFTADIGSNGIIYKFNFVGDTIWTKKVIGNGYCAMNRGALTTNSNYISVGETRDTIYINYEFIIIKIDTLGGIIWEKKLSYYQFNFGYSIDSYANGEFVLGGLTDASTSLTEGDGYLAKLDSLGNLLWQKKIGTTEDDAGILVRISTDENNLFIKQSIDTLVNVGDELEPDYIGKLDNNGNFIWRTFFNGPYKQDIWGIREMENKSIIAVGIKDVDDLGDGRGFICKLDSNGVKLWERTYYSRIDRDNYFTDVAKVSDGGFILTGTAWSDTDQDVWLVRLDSMGCLESGCDIVDVPNVQNLNNALINFYPNPMHNAAIVEIAIPNNFNIIAGAKLSLKIVDINGKIVDEYANLQVSNIGETIRFNVYRKNLPAGIYSAHLRYGDTTIGNVKVIMQ